MIIKGFGRACLIVSLLAMGIGCKRPPLGERLLSPDLTVRIKALNKLGKSDMERKASLVPFLVRALQMDDSQINQRALDALVVVGRPSVPFLIGTLQDQDAYLRLCAVEGLGRLGESASDAIPRLVVALQDTHPLVREEAAIALRNMGPQSRDSVPALIHALQDSRKEVKLAALITLEKIGTPEALSAIKKAARQKSNI